MPLYRLGDWTPQSEAVWIAPDAAVIGKVRFAAGVTVWFGAVLRGDNEWLEFGVDTNIQEHTVVHTDPGHPVVTGRGCTIGHRAILHGCAIGDFTLIGMGATVMNGARIGANSIVAAGALVPEGKVFPDGSLILGVPGRLARPLTEDEIDGNRRSAERYRARGERYARELSRVEGLR